MALTPGSRLGSYEIVSAIGAGGMGEVYRARDTALRRDVAIKVLAENVATDPDRLMRFEREARALAALNHPNIAQIYGLERSGGTPAIVMELVEGTTLADRIKSGAMPPREALPIAHQIALALEAAHASGIIHRDLKPANVKVRSDGAVKVLDFGLAKMLAPAPGDSTSDDSPTATGPAMTARGAVLGTAAYMSPEQAKGRPAGQLADIWAFGVVLFEMLTGRRLFDGETGSEVIAAVLMKDPLFERLPRDVPASVRRLLARCLRKEPRLRLQAVGDARLVVEEALHPELMPDPAETLQAAPSLVPLRRVLWALAGVLAAVAVVLLWRGATESAIAPPEAHALALPSDNPLVPTAGPVLAACGHGTRLVYRAKFGDGAAIFLKRRDQLRATPIAGTEGGTQPFCSPDGDELAFMRGDGVYRVNLTGGQPVRLASEPSPRGGAWFGDTIVYAGTADGLFRMSASGGGRERLTALDPARRERTHRFPSFTPDGRAVLFTVQTSESQDYYEDARIDAVWLDSGKRVTVYDGGASMAVAVASGHLVYAREGTLFAAPLDLQTLHVTGAGAPIVNDVAGDQTSGAVFFSVGSDGTLLFVPGAARARVLARVERSGDVTDLNAPEGAYRELSVSPDGSRVAVVMLGGAGDDDIWTYDFPDGPLRPVTSGGVNRSPQWFTDGARLAYVVRRANGSTAVVEQSVDGGLPTVIREFDAGTTVQLLDVSPDDRWMATRTGTEDGPGILSVVSTDGSDSVRLTDAPLHAENAAFSPDGRWLACDAPSGNRREVFLVALDGSSRIIPVSVNGGRTPRWSRSELFYVRGHDLVALPMGTSEPVLTGEAALLPAGFKHILNPEGALYDIAPDGRWLVDVRQRSIEGRELDVVRNWFEELTRLVPPR